jgi:hypothetical protein
MLRPPRCTRCASRERWKQVAARDLALQLAGNWSTLPLSSPTVCADAARQCRPVWLESLADCEPYPGMAARAARYGYPAQADVPLVVGQRCPGVLVALFDRPPTVHSDRTGRGDVAG